MPQIKETKQSHQGSDNIIFILKIYSLSRVEIMVCHVNSVGSENADISCDLKVENKKIGSDVKKIPTLFDDALNNFN